MSYTKEGADPTTVVDLVAQGYPGGIARRYVKWQVTTLYADGNVGMTEIAFYATPPTGTIVSLR